MGMKDMPRTSLGLRKGKILKMTYRKERYQQVVWGCTCRANPRRQGDPGFLGCPKILEGPHQPRPHPPAQGPSFHRAGQGTCALPASEQQPQAYWHLSDLLFCPLQPQWAPGRLNTPGMNPPQSLRCRPNSLTPSSPRLCPTVAFSGTLWSLTCLTSSPSPALPLPLTLLFFPIGFTAHSRSLWVCLLSVPESRDPGSLWRPDT